MGETGQQGSQCIIGNISNKGGIALVGSSGLQPR